ncbi:MAG: hypothetical protein J6Y94_06555, partial [Bacteriovoracaceae bacterium]|nr:hypothetical protein [Bacteriovoracaceae bacterium]
ASTSITVDSNLVHVGDKSYIIFREGSTGTIMKIYDIGAGLTGTTLDGKNSEVNFTPALGKQGSVFVSQVVYANNGIYAFVNASDQLAVLNKSGTYMAANTVSESSFNLPDRYAYFLKYKELKKISNKYFNNAPLIAGGIGTDEIYLGIVYNGKNLLYKGRLSEFAEWASSLK